MVDKILVLGGILLGSVLVIENMVTGLTGFLFLDTGTNIGFIVLISIFIGVLIGYGMNNWINNNDNTEEDDYDF